MSLRLDKNKLKQLIGDINSERLEFPEYISNSFANPSIISLNSSSHNTTNNEPNDYSRYYSFTNDLPNTTVQNLKSITMLGANIPTPVTNIPDEECTFWYYRQPNVPTSATIKDSSGTILYTIINNKEGVGYIANTNYYTYYDGKIWEQVTGTSTIKWTYNIGLANRLPSTSLYPGTKTIQYYNFNRPINPPNPVFLCYCRILPSFTPPELLVTSNKNYQINRQYSDYNDLETTLQYITQYDPTYSLVSKPVYPTFRPNDITFSFNQNNKYSFTGNNIYDVSGNFQYYYIPAAYNDPYVFQKQYNLNLPNGVSVTYYQPNIKCASDELRNISSYGDGLNSYNGFLTPTQTLDLSGNCFIAQGQPYTKNRTLNLRLGWTNKYNMINNDYYFYVRPIIQPYIELASLNYTLLGQVITNTANNYANLVNTSILYIYADIVGTAGIDNYTNRNLLGIIPLNTANNSVGFYVPAIHHKIINIPDSFNSVKIIFLNEYGNQYYLPNSAITTILIGLEYKN